MDFGVSFTSNVVARELIKEEKKFAVYRESI